MKLLGHESMTTSQRDVDGAVRWSSSAYDGITERGCDMHRRRQLGVMTMSVFGGTLSGGTGQSCRA